MNLRALLVPEYARVPSAWERAEGKIVGQLDGLVVSMIFAGAVLLLLPVGIYFGALQPPCCFVLPAIFVPTWIAFLRWRDRRRKMRIYLNRIGVPTCVACGYDARRMAADTCPECGADVATQEFSEFGAGTPDARRAEAYWRATVALGAMREAGHEAISRSPQGLRVTTCHARCGETWAMETLWMPMSDGVGSTLLAQVAILTRPSSAPGAEHLATVEGLVPAVPRE